jgi:hypothetical protein
MAAKEMYDYLSPATADVAITLGGGAYEIHPQGVIAEIGIKNQEIHEADDNSEERISFSDDSIFRVQLNWEVVTESEAGTLIDFYYDAAKGNGRGNTFQWEHPTDGHTYVVRFDCDMERVRRAHDIYGILNITLRVLGYVA